MISYVTKYALLLTALNCPESRMWNVSKEPWNMSDKKTFETAKQECHLYHPKEPCVKLFRKYEPRMYSVICGDEKSGEVDKEYPNLPKESEIQWQQ